jgi:L,D-transpeptidase ErfK/SrfK
MTREPSGRRGTTGKRGLGIAVAIVMALSSPYASAASFPLAPDQQAVGAIDAYFTRAEDTLLEVARRHDLGYGQLIIANPGIDPWLPGPGRRIVLPNLYLVPDGPRRGIVINLAEQRLYYFQPDGRTMETHPIGVNVQGWPTPLGTTHVTGKQIRPSWYPPASIREEKPELPEVIPPGPDNPLGEYALRLGWPSYVIHGTNKPYGVGRNVSHGCIRLYPEDIERLFGEVAVGTPVRVVDEEIRLAWLDDELYLAVFPNKQQMDEVDLNQPMTQAIPPDLRSRITEAAGPRIARIDWRAVEDIGLKRSGIPYRITKPLGSYSNIAR